MGCKNLKNHFQIKHIVHVRDSAVCIGSPYIPDLFIIGKDGGLLKSPDSRGSPELTRYIEELTAEPDLVKKLIEEPDSYGAALPVYTWDGGKIVERQCEAYGWPNVTFEGELMYENRYSPDLTLTVQRAKRDASLGVELAQRKISDLEKKLCAARAHMEECSVDMQMLDAAYPSVTPEVD
ncbi:hypothetical protein LC612_30840 [Nostoc sp. CHAB 5834]|nr:hypothetical protein [Nostoc sp. CHAB 5834]